MRDMLNNIHPVGPAVSALSDNTAVVSGIVDIKGFDALTFLIGMGTLVDVDATFAVTVDEGDAANLSDAASVATADLIGTLALASFTFAADGLCRKIGYKGTKRYVRCTVTPSANTGAAPIAIIPLLGKPAQAPTPNPPQ
jgi:hypothetical protein